MFWNWKTLFENTVCPGLPPNYFNWDLSEPNGGTVENCTVLEILDSTTIWEDWPCSTRMGFTCEIVGNIRLNFHGLCENRYQIVQNFTTLIIPSYSSQFDTEFTGVGLIKGRLSFRGKYGYTILWQEDTQVNFEYIHD